MTTKSDLVHNERNIISLLKDIRRRIERLERKSPEVAGYDELGVMQFGIEPNTGVATAGLGAVRLDEDGLLFTDASKDMLIEFDAASEDFTIRTAPPGVNRIEYSQDYIAGYDAADVKRFYIEAATGRGVFGAGAGVLDEAGLGFFGSGVATQFVRSIRWFHPDPPNNYLMGRVYSDWAGGGADHAITWVTAERDWAGYWPAGTRVILFAEDTTAVEETSLTVESEGNVICQGISDVQFKVHGQVYAFQDNVAGVMPPLLLTQLDINQDMMELVTTIGVGNAIEAKGAKLLTHTHFVKVTIPGGLTRYFPVGTIA